jgi:outer membrane lipoprotein-sorting protein
MRIFPVVLCLLAGLPAGAQTAEAVLNRMDKTAPAFHAVSANIQLKTYTAILKDTTVETGSFKMQRKGSEVRAMLDFSSQPDSRIIAIMGKVVGIYYPARNLYQSFDVGKNTDVLNQFLLLGFGSSGKDLAQSYTISAEGQENVSGKETTKLLLVPKDAEVKKKLSQIEIWVPNDTAYPVQQEFYAPQGDYRTVTYNDVQLNPPIKGKLELKVPSGVKKQSS